VSPVDLTDGRKAGRGGGRNQIIRPQEAWSSINHSLLSDCTDLRRYTHKTSGFKTSGFKTSGFNTSQTSGLRNVRYTKHHVYKTSGLQNIRLQYVQFQNALLVNISKRPVSKMFSITLRITKKYRAKGLRRYSGRPRRTLPRERTTKLRRNTGQVECIWTA
jgi:hypothetical protein